MVLLGELAHYARALVSEAGRAPDPPIPREELNRTLGWLARPVFICGHHRTATTLMRQLLDGHPELLVLPSEGTYLTSFR